jgi:hypothetical protein
MGRSALRRYQRTAVSHIRALRDRCHHEHYHFPRKQAEIKPQSLYRVFVCDRVCYGRGNSLFDFHPGFGNRPQFAWQRQSGRTTFHISFLRRVRVVHSLRAIPQPSPRRFPRNDLLHTPIA